MKVMPTEASQLKRDRKTARELPSMAQNQPQSCMLACLLACVCVWIDRSVDPLIAFDRPRQAGEVPLSHALAACGCLVCVVDLELSVCVCVVGMGG
jgi:hypothetical protein